jgi:lipopolysaccharide biosynthesis glycosyltransferase
MERRNAICMCVDAHMLIPAFFIAYSVSKASATRDEFDIVLLVPPGNIGPDQAAYAAANGIIVDHSLDLASVEGIPILQDRLSPATLFKLLLARHFQTRYRRILYLDADLTIHGDVAMLFRLDLNDYAVAGCPAGRVWLNEPDRVREEAYSHCLALGMTSPYRFFNTGVMLIDPDRWVSEELGERAIAFLRDHADICPLPDEDALNAVLDGRLLEISPVWNLRTELVPSRHVLPAIIHYAGPDKPWRRVDRLFAFRDAFHLYEEFIAQTPWPDWLRSLWIMDDVVDCLKREAVTAARRVWNPSPLRDPVRRAAFKEERENYYATTKFADVEQGIVVKREGRLQLA